MAHQPVGDVRDRCRWQKKGALRMWLVLGYAEHCKFAFGKHCSGRKNQGKRKPADFFGHRNRKGVLVRSVATELVGAGALDSPFVTIFCNQSGYVFNNGTI